MAKQDITPDFRILLSTPLDSFERPKSVPAGTYTAVIKDTTFGKSRFDKTKMVLIVNIILTGATEDIPADELEGIELSQFKFSVEYEFSKKYMYRFNDFLESLGHNITGKLADEFLHLLPGADVLASVTAKPHNNGKDMINNVTRIVGA